MFLKATQVTLQVHLPGLGLEPGDIGVIVHVHEEGRAYEVAFMTLDGKTIGTEALAPSNLRAVSATAVPHARERGSAEGNELGASLAPGDAIDDNVSIVLTRQESLLIMDFLENPPARTPEFIAAQIRYWQHQADLQGESVAPSPPAEAPGPNSK